MASNHTRPRKKGGALKILLVLLVLMLAAAGGAFLLAKREIDGGTRKDAVTVEIAQGSGVSTIARQLKEAGVIRFPQLFRWYVGRGGEAPVWRIFAGTRQLLRCAHRGAF